MTLCIRSALVATILALGCMFSGHAGAEPFVSKEWGFSAVFPAQAQQSSQPIQTAIGNVTMVSVFCSIGDIGYLIAIADYPTGTVARQTAEATYTGMINGAAGNVGGAVRSNALYTVGNVTGHDVITDVSSKNQTVHSRVFLAGDRTFQIMYMGSTGAENSKDALDFLNSFVLLP